MNIENLNDQEILELYAIEKQKEKAYQHGIRFGIITGIIALIATALLSVHTLALSEIFSQGLRGILLGIMPGAVIGLYSCAIFLAFEQLYYRKSVIQKILQDIAPKEKIAIIQEMITKEIKNLKDNILGLETATKESETTFNLTSKESEDRISLLEKKLQLI